MNDSALDARFPKEARLLSSPEYRRVFERQQSVSDGVLIVYGAPNESNVTRLGMSVSRKVGNAVFRNRWKRQIREAFRLQTGELPKGIDLVVIPRRGAAPDDHHAIRSSLLKLVKRLSFKLEEYAGHEQ